MGSVRGKPDNSMMPTREMFPKEGERVGEPRRKASQLSRASWGILTVSEVAWNKVWT
jgi:hypothetical protein